MELSKKQQELLIKAGHSSITNNTNLFAKNMPIIIDALNTEFDSEAVNRLLDLLFCINGESIYKMPIGTSVFAMYRSKKDERVATHLIEGTIESFNPITNKVVISYMSVKTSRKYFTDNTYETESEISTDFFEDKLVPSYMTTTCEKLKDIESNTRNAKENNEWIKGSQYLNWVSELPPVPENH
jgi:hypothetical protein